MATLSCYQSNLGVEDTSSLNDHFNDFLSHVDGAKPEHEKTWTHMIHVFYLLENTLSKSVLSVSGDIVDYCPAVTPSHCLICTCTNKSNYHPYIRVVNNSWPVIHLSLLQHPY